jgi:DNA-binding transcriptional MerR regulator
MQPLRIGKLARLAKVNVQTLRFYERKGLLSKPTCRLSGYREYPSEAVGKMHIAFYKDQDIGSDEIWDIWWLHLCRHQLAEGFPSCFKTLVAWETIPLNEDYP